MPVLGIDIGGSTSTVATVFHGVIDVVLNDVSQRYTPTYISFMEKQRLFGDQAQSQLVSNFRSTCRSFMSLLGRMAKNDDNPEMSVTKIDEFFSPNGLGVSEDGFVGFKIQHGSKEKIIGTLNALTGYLSFLSHIADNYTGSACREVVLAHPAWFSEIQKECLRASVKASGLDCLTVISEIVAMALDYGVYRVKQLDSETPTTVALIMVGYTHASAAIVDFYSTHCRIISQVTRQNFGGRNFDLVLMDHMASVFAQRYRCNPLEDCKTRLKVESIAIKTKRVLSANSEGSFSAECLMGDYDLSGVITREEFEALCKEELLPTLSELLRECIAKSGRDLESIVAVEIAGGSTRIPCIQSTISAAFGKSLSRTLNADECVARGCVLEAAMKSKHYRVREYKVMECLSRPLCFCWLPGLNHDDFKDAVCCEVLPAGTMVEDVHTINLNLEIPVTIRAAFGDPREVKGPYALGGIEILKRLEGGEETGPAQDSGIAISFSFSKDGRFQFIAAESCEFSILRPPYVFNVEEMAELEKGERTKDKIERERLHTLNDFETLLYDIRDKIKTSHSEFVDQTTSESLSNELQRWCDWLYENADASKEALQEGLNKVRNEWNPVEELYRIQSSKVSDLESFLQRLQDRYNFCCEDNDPAWYGASADERLTYAKRLLDLDANVREMHQQEQSRPKHSRPLFTMEQIESDLQQILRDIDEYCRKRRETAPPKTTVEESQEQSVDNAEEAFMNEQNEVHAN